MKVLFKIEAALPPAPLYVVPLEKTLFHISQDGMEVCAGPAD